MPTMDDMESTSFLRSWRNASTLRRGACTLPVVEIPAAFTGEQIASILALKTMADGGEVDVAKQLDAMTPTRFTAIQVECILELLSLNASDFQATLFDAMETLPTRDPLRAGMLQLS